MEELRLDVYKVVNIRTGDPQHHLDSGVHCAKPERENWELHKCILRLWSLFALWLYK